MFEDLLAQAEEQFVAGRFDAVADLCGDLAADPSRKAYYLLGRTCLALGQSEEALERLAALSSAPSAAPYHTELEELTCNNGRLNARQVPISRRSVSRPILSIRMSI